MNVLTALEIKNNYPEEILINSAQQDNSKFASFLYRLKNGNIHKLLVSTKAIFDSEKEAEEVLHNLCKDISETDFFNKP